MRDVDAECSAMQWLGLGEIVCARRCFPGLQNDAPTRVIHSRVPGPIKAQPLHGWARVPFLSHPLSPFLLNTHHPSPVCSNHLSDCQFGTADLSR